MKDIFMFSFNAVMPILILFLIGYFLKSVGFADEGFFKKANAMVFKVFLPVLLFKNVYDIDSLSGVNLPAIIYCLAAVLVLCFIGFITALFRSLDRFIQHILLAYDRHKYGEDGMERAGDEA